MPTATRNNGELPAEIRNQMARVFHEAVENELLFRRQILSAYLDPRRNIERECGYPDTSALTVQNYKSLFEREPLAERVVSVYPKECWQTTPEVYETEDVNEQDKTPFEEELVSLGRRLTSITSLYQGNEGNRFWEYQKRADILSGIGHYGCLLLGVNDGKPLSEPLDLNDAGVKRLDLLFMRALDEEDAVIAQLNTDPTSIRYTQPESYDIVLSNPNRSQLRSTSVLGSVQTTRVHWTRLVHISDGETIGAPRMRTVYNRLYDLHKLYGGSAEMYWRGAFYGLAFKQQPQVVGRAKPMTTEQMNRFRQQIEDYANSLQRELLLGNMEVQTLAPQVVDPVSQIDVQIEAICIYLGIPKRIFMGSERGELSSNQDTRAWYARCQERQNNFITPRIIVNTIDRLIQCGVLPAPQQYFVHWPDVSSLTDSEKATILTQRTQAYASYVGGQVEGLMSPQDYLVREAGYTIEEAEAILSSTTDRLREMYGQEILGQTSQGETEFEEEGEETPAEVE